MTQQEIIQIFSGFLGSVGFGILFNIRGKRLLAASLGGLVSWLLFLLVNKAICNEVLAYFIVSAMISVYAEIMARVMKTPTTTFVVTSLVPMIPGGSLYQTMVSLFKVGQQNFLQKATHTLEMAAALALGVVVITTFVRISDKILRTMKEKT